MFTLVVMMCFAAVGPLVPSGGGEKMTAVPAELERHLRSQDHVRQDRWLYENVFAPRGVTAGFFVDVGAYGEEGSNTWFYEKALGWDGLLIEPNTLRLAELAATRAAPVLNIAIDENPGTKPFLQIAQINSQLSGLVDNYDPRWSAMLDSHHKQYNYDQAVVPVQCRRLQDVLDERGITVVDYLSVDCEGSEMQVLRSVEWHRMDIRAVTVEDAHSDSPAPAYMAAQGYTLLHRQWPDLFFVRADWWGATQ
jgi:FkbM family methyltransferase